MLVRPIINIYGVIGSLVLYPSFGAGGLLSETDPPDRRPQTVAFAATRRISGQTGSVIYAAFGKQSSGQKSEEIQRYDLLAALDA